jgi:hypothetical protein
MSSKGQGGKAQNKVLNWANFVLNILLYLIFFELDKIWKKGWK